MPPRPCPPLAGQALRCEGILGGTARRGAACAEEKVREELALSFQHSAVGRRPSAVCDQLSAISLESSVNVDWAQATGDHLSAAGNTPSKVLPKSCGEARPHARSEGRPPTPHLNQRVIQDTIRAGNAARRALLPSTSPPAPSCRAGSPPIRRSRQEELWRTGGGESKGTGGQWPPRPLAEVLAPPPKPLPCDATMVARGR